MELSDLRYFVHVALASSFVEGARRAHVSPAAISKAIKRLEQSLEAELFVRSTRKVTLTQRGEVVLAHAQGILLRIDSLHDDVRRAEGRIEGTLTVGGMEVFSTELLPAALADLVRAHPDVRPLCYELVPQDMERLVAEGRCDVGFTIGGGDARGVEYHLLGRSRGVIVCGRTHPLYKKGRFHVRDVGRYSFVVPRFRGHENDPSIDQFPESTCQRMVGCTIELMQMGIEVAVQGAYLGYFPEVSIRGPLRDRRLRALQTSLRGRDFDLHALTRKARQPSPAGERLIELVRARLHSKRDV